MLKPLLGTNNTNTDLLYIHWNLAQNRKGEIRTAFTNILLAFWKMNASILCESSTSICNFISRTCKLIVKQKQKSWTNHAQLIIT